MYEISVTVAIHTAGKTVNVTLDEISSDPRYATHVAMLAAAKAQEAVDHVR